MHDHSAVGYLDDLLGHPVEDAHGNEIPEDDACEKRGSLVQLSVFRTAREGIVESISPKVNTQGLAVGDRLRKISRRDKGRLWVAVREDGKEFALDHEAADAVLIRCV